MIEKLRILDDIPTNTQIEKNILIICSSYTNKINELVDAVNGILDYAPLEMAMKAEPKTELECTRKALAVAKKWLFEYVRTRTWI